MMKMEEKMIPSVEEQEKEEKEDDNEMEDDWEKSSDGDKESEKEIESSVKSAGEKIALPSQVEQNKKQGDVLNLNNEVVKMRKEVKRVRALIIRKLLRQINALKKKKGKEAEVEKNQRRAERLLEEIHCMKKLLPQQVTKTALQKNFNFEQVCRNPKCTISDRAVARIATHPQFVKEIKRIKASVKAFKEEHTNSGKQEGHATFSKSEEETEKSAQSAEDLGVHRKEKTESNIVKSTSVKSTLKKKKPQSKPGKNDSDLQSAPARHQKRADEEKSDAESSDDEEKEYFDDSTEERFHKQSSQSEMSDDDNDFFVGKVSKFKKKKKKQTGTEGEKKVDKGQEEKKDSADNVRTSDKVQEELDKLESRLKSKATSLQSVFCPSLSRPKAGRGSDRGRGRGRFKGQGKLKDGSGVHHESFSKQPQFEKQEKGSSNSGFKYNKPCPDDRSSKSDRKEGRGRGRGAGHVFSHQAQQPLLHPSWEASKKRKEQQGQILAFQGKKIKFNDDD